MTDRSTPTHEHHTVTLGELAATVVPVVLFAIILLFGILVSLRHAHGWTEVLSEGVAATAPMAADGVVGFVSALGTGVGLVWLYLRQLAH